MTAVLASQSSSWFFLKLKAYNDTDRKIPCIVELPSMQDGNLLDTPQEWTCGIVAFSASLGSTSLFYYPQDDAMKIKYVVFEEKGGDLANATPIATQTRSVYKNSYSLGNLMDLLNPRPCDLGKIPISFFILPGGEIGLGPIASNMVKDLAHDNIQVRKDTRCTDIIMSKQLAQNMKMLGQEVSRSRAHTDHKTLLHSLFFEWMNRERFATYKSLARWQLSVPANGTNNQPRVDASAAAGPVGCSFRVLLPRLGGLHVAGPGVYAQAQWTDQLAFDDGNKFKLNGFQGQAPLRFREGASGGVFHTWSIEKDGDNYYLHVNSTSRIGNGIKTIIVEDPVMKSIAWAFQSYVTPEAKLGTPVTVGNHSTYPVEPGSARLNLEADPGLLPPMDGGSALFYQKRFTRYHYPAASLLTRIPFGPAVIGVNQNQMQITVPDVTWPTPAALNSDAREADRDLRFRFEGLNDTSDYAFFETLYHNDDISNNNAPEYVPEQAAGGYTGGNDAQWTIDVGKAMMQAAISLELIGFETPALSKWLAENIYRDLRQLGVIASSTSRDFFTSASVGETENLINQEFIDDTISFAERKTVISANWYTVADVFTVQYPDTPALTRWATDNGERHLREPLVLRAFWTGQVEKDFQVISISAVGHALAGAREVRAMATGSTKPGAVATDLSVFILGAPGSVQRQIFTEDLRTATVVENCDAHGQPGDGFCRFRLLEGDRVISSEPISDSLQYFKSAAVTSNYGFTFKPETTNMNHAANILQSFSLIHDFSVSMDKRFEATGCSASPYGDIYYDCNGNITIHQMVGTAALRSGALQLELQPRDPSQKPVMAELPVGGSFECKLAFFKLNKKA